MDNPLGEPQLNDQTGQNPANIAVPETDANVNNNGTREADQALPRQSAQQRIVSNHDRANKSHTPELVTFFKSLSLKAQLEWNKGREERNLRREGNRIDALTGSVFALSDSEDESIFSIADENLDALCDPEIYESYSDSVPQKLRLKLATRKRKRGSIDPPKEGDSSPNAKRRRMNGKSLQDLGNHLTLLEFPEVMFTTENERVFIPLSLFHPECLLYITNNLNRIPLTRVNPRPGESKGQLVLDIDKLCSQFGEQSAPTFGFDRFLASSVNYIRFQASRDAEVDPVTQQGNGDWSRIWFDHFNFFSSQPEASALYPYWRQSEIKLRNGILNNTSTYSFTKYEQSFELAMTRADISSQQQPSPGPSSQRQFFRADNRTPRSDRKLSPRSKKLICSSCAGPHSAADHIASKLPDTFLEGKPTFCQTSSGKLLHPDGREVCILYNLGSITNKKCGHGSERVHVCSFCGGAHPAFSWSCWRSPI